MNLSTKSSRGQSPASLVLNSNATEDDSIPLNLCVKKVNKTSSNNLSSSTSKQDYQQIFNNSNRTDSHTLNLVKNLANSQLNQVQINNLISQIPQPPPPQKKRGRKPKSLLNYGDQHQVPIPTDHILPANLLAAATAAVAANANAATNPPRKRGRPPSLSPPHNNLASNVNPNLSTSAYKNSYPFNFFNTPSDVLAGWPGLNALTVAAAAATVAAASGGNQLFNNSQNPFNILQKLNPKDFNLNLLNSNLFNWKNPSEQATTTNNEFVNKHSSKIDPNPFQKDDNAQNLLPAFSSKNTDPSTTTASSTINKSSFAHKPNPSEKQLRIPLNHGFKRSTYITGFSKLGTIEGDVSYTAPCGKKIKNFPDLIKYLTKKDSVSLTRDNFSFDPNVIIGQFIQNVSHFGTEVTLTENQMKLQLEEISKIRNLDLSSTSITVQPSSNNHVVPEKKKRVRDSGGTRNVYDSIKNYKNKAASNNDHHNKNELEPSVTITIQNAAPVGRGSKRKSSEKHESSKNEKLLKKQQEEERKQKELKEKEEEERKLKEAQEKQLEIQKQEELKLLAEIEQERINQHQMFIHALNELKSSEERDTKKEELTQEKIALQERKLLKRILENELLKELKKPIEDMMLKDHKALPIFNRIPGLKLTGKAFADMLMVYEFLYNFGETIGFDISSLPNLNSLMMALLNLDSDAEDELMSIVNHLVICAIEDPGIPNNMTTAMGQKLKDAAVTEHNITEILRLYFQSFSKAIREEDEPNRIECKIYERLCNGIPFISMNAVEKLEILVFLCNELLCNQAIVKQIDDSIESVSVFKKDKWGIENDIRKLRVVKMRREKIIEEENAKRLMLQEKNNTNNTNPSETGENTTETQQPTGTETSDCEESNTASSSISALAASTSAPNTTTTTLPLNIEFDDDVNMTNEEIEKKIEKLNKQCNQMNNKMHKALNSYRVFPLGQDRYRRTYWVLPNCGGVFVEGMESGEPEELVNNIWTEEELELEKVLNSEEIDEDIKNEFDQLKADEEENNQQNNEEKIALNKDEDDEEDSKTVVEEEEKIIKTENEEVMKSEPEPEQEQEQEEQTPVEKKEELDESDQSEANNQTNEEVTVDDIRWFDLDLDFQCDEEEVPENEEKVKNDEGNGSEAEEKTSDQAEEKTEDTDNPESALVIDSEAAEVKNDDDDDDNEDKEMNEEIVEESFEPTTELEKALTTFLQKETLDCLFKSAHRNIESAILKDCLIRILSSFPKSASTTEFPNSDVIETDIIVCPTLQKRIQLWKVLQYDVPRKVPREYQLGWWRITDGAQLKSMIELLHSNALREKNLQKHLIKHLNYTTQSCKNSAANFDVNDYDRDSSETREHGAPTENRCPHRSCHNKGHCQEVALRKDIQVLELIEAFEEKILACSMQIRNWKPSNKLSSTDFKSKMAKLKKSENRNNNRRAKTKNNNNSDNSDNSSDSINENGFNHLVIDTDDNGTYDLLRIQKEKLLEIEATIERRYLKPPLGFKNNQAVIVNTSSDNGNGDDYNEYANDDNATAGLIRWRDAARDAKYSSQIAMGLHFLENCIAWDKSIMRASCQFCGSGQNEAELLLCDLCDKGYHMYCFKPKMENVPEGDWFCFDCQNKNTIDKVCIVCGKKGKLLNCDTCAKAFHPNCLDPPVNKQVKGKWVCHMCLRKNKRYSGAKSSKKSSTTNTANDDKNHETSANDKSSSNTKETPSNKRMSNGNAKEKAEKPEKKERKPKKEKEDKEKSKKEKEKEKENNTASNNSTANNNNNNKDSHQVNETVAEQSDDITLCKQITDEIINQETSWPFLEPVNTKHFPTYRKIIKKPIDFTIINNKFQNNSYKTKEEFAADIRLMFDNCVTFNEDESPVGQAGHLLRAFFENRWKELFNAPP